MSSENKALRSEQKNTTASANEFVGILRGILADGSLNQKEIIYLDTWLKDNPFVAETWPASVIKDELEKALTYEITDTVILEKLVSSLSQIIGGTMQETGATSGLSTTLPLEEIEIININGSRFCLTGGFAQVARGDFENNIINFGGIIDEDITLQTNYLVVGQLASPAWSGTSHGRKIEKAIRYKSKGSNISIVAEKSLIKWFNRIEVNPSQYFNDWAYCMPEHHWNSVGVARTQLIDKEKTKSLREGLKSNGANKGELTKAKILRIAFVKQSPPNYSYIEGQVFLHCDQNQKIQIVASPSEESIEVIHLYGNPLKYQQAYILKFNELEQWLRTGAAPDNRKVQRFSIRSEIFKYMFPE